MIFAKLARFYGWSLAELSLMPINTALKYKQSAEILEAQEALFKISILDYQKHMTQQDRKKFHKQLKKQATAHQKKKTESMDDLENLLEGILNGR